MQQILAVAVRGDVDLVASRIRSREVARTCGFQPQEQVLISGIVAEITRSVFGQAQAAELEFFLAYSLGNPQLAISISTVVPRRFADKGKLANTVSFDDQVLAAGRRFMDSFVVGNEAAGVRIDMTKSPPSNYRRSFLDMVNSVADFAPLPNSIAVVHARRENDSLEELLATVHARETELLIVSTRLKTINDEVAELNSLVGVNYLGRSASIILAGEAKCC